VTEDWCATIQCFADTQPGWQEKSVEVQYRGAGLTGKVSLRLPSAYIGDPDAVTLYISVKDRIASGEVRHRRIIGAFGQWVLGYKASHYQRAFLSLSTLKQIWK